MLRYAVTLTLLPQFLFIVYVAIIVAFLSLILAYFSKNIFLATMPGSFLLFSDTGVWSSAPKCIVYCNFIAVLDFFDFLIAYLFSFVYNFLSNYYAAPADFSLTSFIVRFFAATVNLTIHIYMNIQYNYPVRLCTNSGVLIAQYCR